LSESCQKKTGFFEFFYFGETHKTIVNIGGRGGIRTHGRVTPTPDFESGAFSHSATLPLVYLQAFADVSLFVIFALYPGFVSRSFGFVNSKPESRKRDGHLSKDGAWRSFPNVPNLTQYVSNGNYYGRIKVGGKLIRESLKTTVWTTAKLRLADFQKRQQEGKAVVVPPKFSEAVELFKQELANDTTIKPRSKEYRLLCLQKIETSWPGLWELGLDAITAPACKEWAAKLNGGGIASHYFNNTIGTLRQVIDVGLKAHKANGGAVFDNPAAELKRVKVKQKELQLPEPSQFKDLVANIRTKSGAWGQRVGDLVEFLAYGGMRINSEAMWVEWADVDWPRKEIIVRGDPVTATKNSELRRVPILPDMEVLLTRLKEKLGSEPTGRIMAVGECALALTRACRELGLSKLTHHDLRHLFATRCIESGVDIPTVSRWLGHKDGGALAMKTYGHLRREHSQAMAQKVKF
jgi:integrase